MKVSLMQKGIAALFIRGGLVEMVLDAVCDDEISGNKAREVIRDLVLTSIWPPLPGREIQSITVPPKLGRAMTNWYEAQSPGGKESQR